MALSSVEKITLTTDCWTALTRESYITITCHYINSEWQMKSAVLLTESMLEKHTSNKLAEKLKEAIAHGESQVKPVLMTMPEIW